MDGFIRIVNESTVDNQGIEKPFASKTLRCQFRRITGDELHLRSCVGDELRPQLGRSNFSSKFDIDADSPPAAKRIDNRRMS